MFLNDLQEIVKKYLKAFKHNVVQAVIITVVIIAVLGVSFYVVYFKNSNKPTGTNNPAAQTTAQKVIDYINDNVLKDKTGSSLKTATEVSGMYKLTINFKQQNQDFDVYVTKDGRYLFPVMQGIPIDLDENSAAAGANSNNSQVTSCENVKKSNQPVLEAFVVSQCPYGLQMQRVLAKVVEGVDLKDNIKVEYIGSISNGKISSMHGDTEAQENLRQICIREEQSSKYWDYISCYIGAGKTDECLTSAGVDETNLNTCMSDSNKGLKYAQEDFTLADQYGVQGSPTLVVAGDQVDESSFGGRTADALKTLVCCAFNNKPNFCSQTLSTDSAAAGFSTSYGSGTSADNGGGCE